MGSNIVDTSKYDKFLYNISTLLFTYDGSNEEIRLSSKLVTSINMIHDYDNNITPGIVLTMGVPYDTYYKILPLMSTLKVSFSINIICIGNDVNDMTDYANSNSYQQRKWMSGTFKVVNHEDLDVIKKKIYRDPKIELDELSTENTIAMTFYLFDHEKIEKYRRMHSYILNGSMNDLICKMLSDREMTNVIYTSNNSMAKEQYLIPYGHLGDNLQSLNQIYGIYDSPYLFYMDINKTYLIDKESIMFSSSYKNKSLEKGELPAVLIYMEAPMEVGSAEYGSYIDNRNQVYVFAADNLVVGDRDSLTDYAMFGKIKSILSGENTSMSDEFGTYDIERAFVVNNKKQHNQLLYKTRENKKNISFIIKSADCSVLTPNKKYQIILSDNFLPNYDINGIYRLSNTVLTFKASSNDTFTCDAAIKLYRVYED